MGGADALGDELGEVLVRRDHERLETRRFGTFDQRADDIVRFKSIKLQPRNTESIDSIANKRELRHKVFGCWWPVSFIFRVDIIAKSFAR